MTLSSENAATLASGSLSSGNNIVYIVGKGWKKLHDDHSFASLRTQTYFRLSFLRLQATVLLALENMEILTESYWLKVRVHFFSPLLRHNANHSESKGENDQTGRVFSEEPEFAVWKTL